jgi:hypothetical protein
LKNLGALEERSSSKKFLKSKAMKSSPLALMSKQSAVESLESDVLWRFEKNDGVSRELKIYDCSWIQSQEYSADATLGLPTPLLLAPERH